MGHIDSGKTSLCKVLTSIASTASLDKNPQSQERGITIDLGFSALYTLIPDHLRPHIDESKKYIQYTLVDCPGHASLMKTIIASSKIIDMLVLVIDINKGIQVSQQIYFIVQILYYLGSNC
jgi:selenocysteine-specific elongation factor